MNTFTQFLKRFKAQILTVFMAAGLLLTTTACNPPAPEVSGTGTYESRPGQTEIYAPIQEKQGGMNEYSDTDPRRATAPVERKADALIDKSKRNVRQARDLEGFKESYQEGRPVGERARNLTENVTEAAEDVGEDVAEGTQRGIRNIKRNVQNATRTTQESAERAAENVQDTARETAKDVQHAAEDTADNLS